MAAERGRAGAPLRASVAGTARRSNATLVVLPYLTLRRQLRSRHGHDTVTFRCRRLGSENPA